MPAERRVRRRLSKLKNVRNALADVVRELESGEADVERARTLVYALSILAKVIDADHGQTNFAERMAAVEKCLSGGAPRGNHVP